jgi:hypothetical protein
MKYLDQRICAWGGPFCALFFGVGLLLAGFVPPPSPELPANEVAAVYRASPNLIRAGMVLGLFGIGGWIALVGVVSAQMRRIPGASRAAAYLQLGAGSIGVLTVMFPVMIFAVAAFRPERDPALTQAFNDLGWLFIIPAFPTFLVQFFAIACAVWQDRGVAPVFPRWVAYFNVWVAVLFVPGGFAYFFRHGPFAWNGVLAFWIAAAAFFAWLVVMTPVLLAAIKQEERANRGDALGA